MRLMLAALLLVFAARLGHAQAIMAPTAVEFDDADYDTATVDSYVLEIWTPGSDTVNGQPMMVSTPIPKAQATLSGTVQTHRQIIAANWALAIPRGPTFVATLRSLGPGGTARSAASNPFSFPLLVPAPRAVTGLTVVAK
jgi:hypothetical protein